MTQALLVLLWLNLVVVVVVYASQSGLSPNKRDGLERQRQAEHIKLQMLSNLNSFVDSSSETLEPIASSPTDDFLDKNGVSRPKKDEQQQTLPSFPPKNELVDIFSGIFKPSFMQQIPIAGQVTSEAPTTLVPTTVATTTPFPSFFQPFTMPTGFNLFSLPPLLDIFSTATTPTPTTSPGTTTSTTAATQRTRRSPPPPFAHFNFNSSPLPRPVKFKPLASTSLPHFQYNKQNKGKKNINESLNIFRIRKPKNIFKPFQLKIHESIRPTV
jgi:hypothetical protein